jgi:SAM-dependent methyltransferase
MDLKEFATMYRAEGRHWWYRGLRAILFRRTGLDRPESRAWHILDAGCGTGGNLSALRRSGHAHAQGFDYDERAIFFCRKRGLDNVRQGSIVAIPFPDATFDLAFSNDVISDAGTPSESAALAELYRVLKPGGRLFVNLPAYAFQHAEHDRAVRTERRYTMRELRQKVEAAGFEILRLSHWNVILFPVVVAVRLSSKYQHRDEEARSDITIPLAPINRLLTFIVKVESRLMDWITIPFGSSVICLARKPAGPGSEHHV